MTSRLWIITPVYFDVEALLLLRQRLGEALAPVGKSTVMAYRIIVVDDSAGTDPAVGSLPELPDVDVITPPFNLGHQRAIVYGLRRQAPAFGPEDVIVTMDSDGEDRPGDLPLLVARVRESDDPGTVALAIRTDRHETLAFRIFYSLFKGFFWILTGTVVRSGNFAAFRGSLVHRIIEHPSFDLCYSSSLIALGLPLAPVPCPRGKRYAGQSRMNFSRLILHGISMLMPFTDRIAIRALLSLLATTVASLLGAAVVLFIKLFTAAGIPGWATSALLGLLVLCVLSVGNVVVLLLVFSQSRATSLRAIEQIDFGPAR